MCTCCAHTHILYCVYRKPSKRVHGLCIARRCTPDMGQHQRVSDWLAGLLAVSKTTKHGRAEVPAMCVCVCVLCDCSVSLLATHTHTHTYADAPSYCVCTFTRWSLDARTSSHHTIVFSGRLVRIDASTQTRTHTHIQANAHTHNETYANASTPKFSQHFTLRVLFSSHVSLSSFAVVCLARDWNIDFRVLSL